MTPASSMRHPRVFLLLNNQIFRRLYSVPTNSGSLIRQTSIAAPGTGHIRILSLNRPAARNALSRALLSELQVAVESIEAEYDENGNEVAESSQGDHGPTRAVILASDVDSCFCAGADLKERATFSQKETDEFLRSLRSTFTQIAALPVPTISAISSMALGGGLELGLCTHLRVLTSNAIVGLPETRLGIIPGAGGTFRLRRLIGSSRAMDLILTGRRVGAREALDLGLANRVVEVNSEETEPAETVLQRASKLCLEAAVNLAQQICEGGPVAIRAAVPAVRYASSKSDGTSEQEYYQRVVGTEDRNEALAAFKEKRRPVFKGK